LKAHYDPEFNVALLNNTSLQKEKKGESVIATYLTEMMKKGYTIIPPNVNLSERSFTLKSNSEIVWGLNWIKNLTDKSIFDILSDRELNGEFKNIDDFYERIGGTALNKRVIEALIWSGTLDVFIDGEVFSTRWDVHNYIFGKLKKTSKFQPLTGSNDDLIEKEIEYLSISFEEINNFGKIRKTWEEQSGAEMDFLYLVEDEGQFNAIGIIDRIEEKKTKNGKDYRRITLRDETKILKMVYVWPWKCKGWDSLRKGMLIQASLTNDGTFIHLVGWTMINQSEKQKQIEEKEKQEKKQQETQEKQQQEQEYKKFLDAFKQIYNKWNKQFDVKREIDDISKQPVLRISSKYDSSNIIVYHYSEEKGIPRKDVIKMKEYDAIYIISDLGEYLFDMHTFQSKMTKVKSQNRIKYPNIPGDIEKELPEEVIENKLS
jgi:DNA polymerase III alpha subunit